MPFCAAVLQSAAFFFRTSLIVARQCSLQPIQIKPAASKYGVVAAGAGIGAAISLVCAEVIGASLMAFNGGVPSIM